MIQTLDGEERKLKRGQLVIADAERPQCIAGVMGAFDSEVTSATDSIFLESAYFSPVSIRRTAQELAIRSEAAIRFGKGLDPETVPTALDRVASLVQQLKSGPGGERSHRSEPGQRWRGKFGSVRNASMPYSEPNWKART